MQIDPIKVTDFMKSTEGTSIGTKSDLALEEKGTNERTELKTIRTESVFYNKKGQNADDETKEIAKESELGSNTMAEINNLSKNIDEEAVEKVEDDGYDIMDLDSHTIVTVVDEIKLSLAKGGKDISAMGGLDEDVLEEMTGSVAQAMELSRGIDENLSDATIKYMVTNELKPTIQNLYNATYAAPSGEDGQVQSSMTDDELIDLLSKLSDKLDSLIEEAECGDKDLCGKMLQLDIPLTKNNLEYMSQLTNFEKPDENEILSAIDDSIAEGNEPEQAYLIDGYSLMDQAREKVDEIQSMSLDDLTDVQAKIQLTEVQLSMTVEATFTMMKNGVDVNTNDLSDLLDKLKLQENSLLNMLMKTDDDSKTDENISLFQETLKEMADISASPAALFGKYTNVSQSTISELHSVSVSFTASFTEMQATYEAVGTEVRKDLGDSISKAFQNVDDILEDIGLETSDSNEKAVRALAYNNMEITEESVTQVKNNLELVNRTFKNMTPAVVTEMIKKGENPLDIKLSELNEKTEELKVETGSTSDNESFAKFLWKAEHTDGISEDERESYIGIYRLMNQVDKTDGAAVGALIAQGTEVTLRNLMTAVRSSKHTGREYEVSDQAGSIEQINVQGLSVTEQVEKAFMTNRCRDAKEAMTPAKLSNIGEQTYMEMNPDEFAQALEEQNDEETEAAYNRNLAEQLQNAIQADKNVYQIIEEYNLPNSANMISAIQAMLEDNNQAIKDLYSKYSKQTDIDMDYLINEITERFGEACKTPEEMAEAEEALGELAERVMKTMIDSEDVQKIDLDGMKLIIQQTKAYNEMAKGSETYNIPIMVADEAGNLNLKIVRGSNESGLVKLVMNMTSTGVISSTFRYEQGQVNGTVSCETNEMREAFAADAPIIAQTMQEETGFAFNLSFGRNQGLTATDIYKAETGNFDSNNNEKNPDSEIQTEALYGIARGFIRVIGEMFS